MIKEEGLSFVQFRNSVHVLFRQSKVLTVKVLFDSPQVRASIQDNGRGLPGGDQPVNHYGLVIMQDRARTLGGKLTIRNRDTGGAEVLLAFIPKSRHMIPSGVSTG